MQRVWTKLLVVGLVMGLASAAYSVTYQAYQAETTTEEKIAYWVGVALEKTFEIGEVTYGTYRVDVSITPVQPDTKWSGYGLNWVQVKVSDAPQKKDVKKEDDTVIPVALPGGWDETQGQDSYFAEFSGPWIKLEANKPITLSYKLTVPKASFKTDEWPIKANYTPKTGPGQIQHSLTLVPTVIPEPATLLLFGMGLAVPLGLLRRKS